MSEIKMRPTLNSKHTKTAHILVLLGQSAASTFLFYWSLLKQVEVWSPAIPQLSEL